MRPRAVRSATLSPRGPAAPSPFPAVTRSAPRPSSIAAALGPRRCGGADRRGSCRSSMPSRSPRSATTICGAGQIRWMAAKIAQPGSTKSARSGADARMARQPVPPQRAQRCQRGLAASSRDSTTPSTSAAAIARQPQHDAGQRGDRARGAEQPHAAAADLVADAMHQLERRRPARRLPPPWRRSRRRVKAASPNRSAKVTTPTGSEA